MQRELEGKVDEQRVRNLDLAKEVEKQRQEIEMLVGGLESVVRDLEGANGVLEGAVVEERGG